MTHPDFDPAAAGAHRLVAPMRPPALRWHPKTLGLLACSLVVFLTGCSTADVRPGPSSAANLVMSSSTDKRTGVADYPVDIIDLLVTGVQRNRADAKSDGAEDEKAAKSLTLEGARKYFYETCGDRDRCAQLRDRIQDRLVWVSERACSDYLFDLRKAFTNSNAAFGGWTTVLGALGGIMNTADAARVFSGAAAATSGLRAEYNDVYFSSQAFELISKSVRAVRERTLNKVREYRLNRNIFTYTLDEAVGDVMRYHTSCNVLAGLEEASESVTREKDPGFVRMSSLLQSMGVGATVNLGTAALDTSALPFAQESCQTMAGAEAEWVSLYGKTQATKKVGDTSDALGLVAMLAELAKKKESHDAAKKKFEDDKHCAADGKANKLDTAMLGAIQDFRNAPQAEKASKKLDFDSKRSAAQSEKSIIDQAASALNKLTHEVDVIRQDYLNSK